MIDYRPATLADVDFFNANLRPHDREEHAAMHGSDYVRPALELAVKVSHECTVAALDGVPFSLYGIGPGPRGDVAVPWLLGTPVVSTQRKFLCGHMRREVRRWSQHYPILFNFVLASHTKTVAWLQYLGFTVEAPIPYGVEQKLHRPFYQVSA